MYMWGICTSKIIIAIIKHLHLWSVLKSSEILKYSGNYDMILLQILLIRGHHNSTRYWIGRDTIGRIVIRQRISIGRSDLLSSSSRIYFLILDISRSSRKSFNKNGAILACSTLRIRICSNNNVWVHWNKTKMTIFLTTLWSVFTPGFRWNALKP